MVLGKGLVRGLWVGVGVEVGGLGLWEWESSLMMEKEAAGIHKQK